MIFFSGCTPKVFYLFSRHATRYPDEEDIEEMIKLLPDLQNRMLNNSHIGKCKFFKKNLNVSIKISIFYRLILLLFFFQ